MLEILAKVGDNGGFVIRGFPVRTAAILGAVLWIGAGLGVWGGWAQSAENPNSRPEIQEGELPAEILTALDDVYSIQAALRFQAEVLGKKWEGRGIYAEVRSGPIPKSRLEIRSGLTGVERRLLQVCDGKTVWLHDGIENAERVIKVDAVRCREVIEANPDFLSSTGLGLGGISGLIRGLDSRFHFDPPQRDGARSTMFGTLKRAAALHILQDRGSESKNGDAESKSESEGRSEGRSEDKSGPAEWGRLPPRVPTHVVLRFTAGSPIPNVVEYYRKTPGSAESRPLIRLVIEKTRVNAPVQTEQFSFTPPAEVEVLDHTDRVLEED